MTTEQNLRSIWKRIRSSNLLLAGLIDVETMSSDGAKLLQKTILKTEEIVKRLGKSINLSLFEKESSYYYLLSADDANVWAKMSSKNDQQIFVANNDAEETNEGQATINDDDETAQLIKDASIPQKMPYLLFSSIELAFQYFFTTPRYYKEASVLDPILTGLKSSLDIGRGDILCVKRHTYETKLASFAAYYHFGVYVGNMTINDSLNNPVTLENAVIDLNRTDDKKVIIRAIPLASDEKDKGFLLHKKDSKNPPLFFKAVYEGRTHEQKELTAERAEEFYRNQDRWFAKYSVLSNNCEHFVNECAFGTMYCAQHTRFVLTTIAGFCKTLSALVKILRWALIAAAEASERFPKSIITHSSYIGESVALGMLVIECVGRILWDIHLLKKSPGSKGSKIKYILKKRLLSMAPEFLAAIGFLLVGVLCTVSGPLGVIIGVGGCVVLLLLRFIARPRIERWIEEREVARRENFLRSYPSEVARLVMKTASDDDVEQFILDEFDRQNLSGDVIAKLMREKHGEDSALSFEDKFRFLGAEKLEIFTNNLNNIFGHLAIENIKSSVTVTYEEQSFTVKRSVTVPITAHQLLEMAKLNWDIDFAKGQWQLSLAGPETGERSIVASSATSDLAKPLDLDPDSVVKLELSYIKPDRCTLL